MGPISNLPPLGDGGKAQVPNESLVKSQPITADLFSGVNPVVTESGLQEMRVAITPDHKIAIQTIVKDPLTGAQDTSVRIFHVKEAGKRVQGGAVLQAAKEKVENLFRDQTFGESWIKAATKQDRTYLHVQLGEKQGELKKGENTLATARYETSAMTQQVALPKIPQQGVPVANPNFVPEAPEELQAHPKLSEQIPPPPPPLPEMGEVQAAFYKNIKKATPEANIQKESDAATLKRLNRMHGEIRHLDAPTVLKESMIRYLHGPEHDDDFDTLMDAFEALPAASQTSLLSDLTLIREEHEPERGELYDLIQDLRGAKKEAAVEDVAFDFGDLPPLDDEGLSPRK